VSPFDQVSAYETMCRIRRFEETILDKFATGVFHGTTHTYIGQEANAVGILSQIQDGDAVFSNHRCHGHFIAYGGDMRGLFAELMGKATGVAGGRGGSQHVHWRNFYSNGVLGNAVPVATGVALANRLTGTEDIVVVFMGDGALGEGVVYEALNMASLWSAPVLYVVEDNGIAQTTPRSLAFSGGIADRFNAFAVPATEVVSSDVEEIAGISRGLLHEVREKSEPRALVIGTNRFGPHSKGDDTRPADEIEAMRATSDPVAIHGPRTPNEERRAIEARVEIEVAQAFETALADPVAVMERVPA
jgi:TPP-dependent pyruvate/acetoin dehydrogenase alpha subunit